MTAHARTRPRLTVRLADLFRSRQRLPDPPDLVPMRVADYGDGPKIIGFQHERPAGPGLAYDHPGWDDWRSPRVGEEPHPPWVTAPQPALAGPGSLAAFRAAADIRDQHEHLTGGHDLTVIDAPVARSRPYAPEPELEPEPELAWYPPLDLRADLAECLIFRDTVRNQLVRQERARGDRPAGPWLQVYADVYERRIDPGALTGAVRP